MPPATAFPEKPVVLITNDDGPPSASSPNIYSFVKLLKQNLGWDVKVVIPDCQKSWVGKAYAISDVIEGRYFYPREPDGLQGDITTESRPLKKGETMEWIMLSGTPATCSNIALHNIYPGQIDLVLSGPNHGRNSSSAFTLSSGTIGATLSSTLSAYPSIAISYGVVTRPVTPRALELANETAVEVVEKLWKDWGRDGTQNSPFRSELSDGTVEADHRMKGKVQLYNVNLGLVEEHLEKDKRKVVWTRIARNGYGQLFKTKPMDPKENRWDSKPTSLTSVGDSWAELVHLYQGTSSLPDYISKFNTLKGLIPKISDYVAANIWMANLNSLWRHTIIPIPNKDNMGLFEIQRAAMEYNGVVGNVRAKAEPLLFNNGETSAVNQPNTPQASARAAGRAGPAAIPIPDPAKAASSADVKKNASQPETANGDTMKFFFAPEMKRLIFPEEDELIEGTDSWALFHGCVSVTPLQASFAEPPPESYMFGSQSHKPAEEGKLIGQW